MARKRIEAEGGGWAVETVDGGSMAVTLPFSVMTVVLSGEIVDAIVELKTEAGCKSGRIQGAKEA